MPYYIYKIDYDRGLRRTGIHYSCFYILDLRASPPWSENGALNPTPPSPRGGGRWSSWNWWLCWNWGPTLKISSVWDLKYPSHMNPSQKHPKNSEPCSKSVWQVLIKSVNYDKVLTLSTCLDFHSLKREEVKRSFTKILKRDVSAVSSLRSKAPPHSFNGNFVFVTNLKVKLWILSHVSHTFRF